MPPASPENSEWLTRKKLIDPMLIASGWRIVSWEQVKDTPLTGLPNCAIEEFPTEAGPADYALCVDGSILGVVEAKKLTVGPRGVLPQAQRYSKGLTNSPHNFDGFRVPFLYSTNGEAIWFHDVRESLSASRRIMKFHTPDALREMLGRDLAKAGAWLLANPPTHSRLRYYQKEANVATEKAIAEQKRQMLVAMATGTGKTFTMVNQCYRLLKSQAARRILFLVDRRALAAQAVRAFSVFEPEPNQKFDKLYEVYSNRFQKEDFGEEDAFDARVLPRDYLQTPQAKHVFVYICTIQRMAINLLGRQAVWTEEGDEIDDDADRVDIPIHAFDVIVADECHRGYTTAELSAWRTVLDHFDAVKIGLTATPAAHTKAYFHDVVFRYTYDQAVREGHLVDYDLVKIKSDVRINGVFLKEGERIEIIDPVSGAEKLDALEDERTFESTEVERKVTSPDSNRKILLELKKYADEHEQRYGRFPKMLIFAANDLPHTSHADELCRLAVEIWGRGESFARKITGRVDRPLQAIREFRNRPNPGIAVTVDLLSTGVDVPDIEYIVFLRSVKSRILFEQMLGRGTRKGDKFPDKSHFTVFDCFDGTLIAYFKNSTNMTAEPPDKPTRSVGEVIEDIWENRDRDYNIRCLAKRFQRIDKEMAPDARELFAAHGIPDGDISKFAAELAGRLKQDFTGIMQVLRTDGLKGALESYPRRPKIFVRAPENEDVVSSEYLIRDGLGKEHKPEDYLEIFARFVRDNSTQVEAVRILLERPADWSTTALTELKQKLTAAPERFTIDVLQKAHELQYHKSLVDIISMVKHAVTEQSPLLTAEERATRAIEQVSLGRTFNGEQQAWLNRIRESIVANLSIEPDDFDVLPTLEGAGGWRKANLVFDGKLNDLIQELNKAVAA